MAVTDLSAGADPGAEPRRVIVVLRRKPEASPLKRTLLVSAAALFVLVLGIGLGHRTAGLFAPAPPAAEVAGQLSERVSGGLYALELATPTGQSRWMLEFDAEVVTRDGPKNPLELRSALEDLVITATSLPLVQASEAPEEDMRKAMLAIAAQNYPWLLDVYMTRSDIRVSTDKLGGIGRALRNLVGE